MSSLEGLKKLLFAIEAFESLFFYGASGIVALGYYINSVASAAVGYYPILWFCGGLLVYNVDRFIPDPADRINAPRRAHLAKTRLVIIGAALLALLLAPILHGDWVTLGAVTVGLVGAPFYSVAIPGFRRRVKEFPLCKAVAPPLIILLTLTIPIWNTPSTIGMNKKAIFVGIQLFIGLIINVLLFDHHDRTGDRTTGVTTFANQMQPELFFKFTIVLWMIGFVGWLLVPSLETIALSMYILVLIVACKSGQSRRFYQWAVDGLLFVPLAVVGIKSLVP